MSEYSAVIFAASAMVSIAGFAFYSGKNEQVMRFAMGIILFCAIISPFISLFSGIADMDFSVNVGAGENVYEKTAEQAFCEGIELAVEKEFSLAKEDVSAKAVGFLVENLRSEKVIITLRGKACVADFAGIRAFVEENNFGKCEVNVEFG